MNCRYAVSRLVKALRIPNIEVALGGDNTAGTRVWWDVPTEGRDENNRIIPKNF